MWTRHKKGVHYRGLTSSKLMSPCALDAAFQGDRPERGPAMRTPSSSGSSRPQPNSSARDTHRACLCSLQADVTLPAGFTWDLPQATLTSALRPRASAFRCLGSRNIREALACDVWASWRESLAHIQNPWSTHSPLIF